jgi:hypothetical protein
VTDAKGIARGLTEAQKRALLWLRGGATRVRTEDKIGRKISDRTMDGLDQRGLIEWEFTRGWRLTDLGLAVRRELAAGRGDGDGE